MDNERIKNLKNEIAILKSQWPAHSVPPAMLQRLDELDEELEKELQNAAIDETKKDSDSSVASDSGLEA